MAYDDTNIKEVSYLMQEAYKSQRKFDDALDTVFKQLPDDWKSYFTRDILYCMWQSIDAYVDINE